MSTEPLMDRVTASAEAPAATAEPVEERYAVIEIFGHRKHVGRVMEVERYGAKMLRVDVPKDGDFALGYETHFYSGAAIFGETPCTLAMVKKANEPYRYSQPALMDRSRDDDDDTGPQALTDEDVDDGEP